MRLRRVRLLNLHGCSEASTLGLLLPRHHALWLLCEVLQLSLVCLFYQTAILLLRPLLFQMIEIVHTLFLFLLDIDETVLGVGELIRNAQDFAQSACAHLPRAVIPGTHLVQSVALSGDAVCQLRHAFVGVSHGLLLGVLWHHHRALAMAVIAAGIVAT